MSFDIHITVHPTADLGRGFTGADWFWDERGDLQVRVSQLNDWRHECALGIHEVVEAMLCKYNGVSQASVDAFDREYERTHVSDLNAGDDAYSPYRREHCFATACERILAAELGICWDEYEKELSAIPLKA